METKQSLSIANCFTQSISLTFSGFFAFLGAAILACIFSVLSLGFMFPCLMTGLENMYLRAKTGEQVKATDVFMHRRKWWSLYWDSVVLAWHIGWPVAVFGFAVGNSSHRRAVDSVVSDTGVPLAPVVWRADPGCRWNSALDHHRWRNCQPENPGKCR